MYDRSADGDYEVRSDEHIKSIYARKSVYYSEAIIYPYLQEKHFVAGIVERTRSIMKVQRPRHPWNNLSDHDFFTAAGLYRLDLATNQEGFTLGALLLFGREEHILSAVPHYKTDALLRKADLDRYDDRVNIRCNLIDAYELLMDFAAKHLPDKFHLEGNQSISLRDTIFREIVVNFIIHREYLNAHPATFVIYKDRVETQNANKPHTYGLLYPGNFEPFPKNPNIAKIFVQMGMAEELGTGIRKVYQYIKYYSGSDKVEFLEEDQFVVKVPLLAVSVAEGVSDIGKKVTEKVTEPLSANQDKIISAIKKNSRISALTLSEILGISLRKTKENLKKLKSAGIIRRVGPDKGGHWEAVDKS